VTRRIVVSGTGTEIGKTFVAARLIHGLRERGATVVARKPVQSFSPNDGPTDADVLGEASGQDPLDVCPSHRWYELPMAPPMAARSLGRPAFSVADLVGETLIPPADLALVEGVGGPRSPLAEDGDTVALAAGLHADLVVLVADAGLGTINSVRMSVDAFGGRPVTVFLNRYDDVLDLHVLNRTWLAEKCDLEVYVDHKQLVERLSNGG
jgi:dethiobiotin synthetase